MSSNTPRTRFSHSVHPRQPRVPTLAHTARQSNLIECPKHNGCFDFKTGLPKRLPVKTRLATYATKVEDGTVFVRVGDGKHVQVRYDEDALQEKNAAQKETAKVDSTW